MHTTTQTSVAGPYTVCLSTVAVELGCESGEVLVGDQRGRLRLDHLERVRSLLAGGES